MAGRPNWWQRRQERVYTLERQNDKNKNMLVLEELKEIEEVLKDKYREKTCDIEVSSSVLFCYIIFYPPSPSPNWI